MNRRRGRSPRELPIACKLTGEEQSQRRSELAQELFSRSKETNELDDGYEFVFPGDASQAEKLLRFIVSERECCPFLVFEVLFEPEEGDISLRIRGPEGDKEFIGTELSGLGTQ